MAMLPTAYERDFGREFFDSVVDWVAGNLEPDEVFPRRHLTQWIKDNMLPEEVCTEEALAGRAFENRYVEEE